MTKDVRTFTFPEQLLCMQLLMQVIWYGVWYKMRHIPTRAFRHVLPAPPTPRVRRCLVALTDGSTDIDVLSDFIRHLSDGDTTHPRGHIIVPEM